MYLDWIVIRDVTEQPYGCDIEEWLRREAHAKYLSYSVAVV